MMMYEQDFHEIFVQKIIGYVIVLIVMIEREEIDFQFWSLFTFINCSFLILNIIIFFSY